MSPHQTLRFLGGSLTASSLLGLCLLGSRGTAQATPQLVADINQIGSGASSSPYYAHSVQRSEDYRFTKIGTVAYFAATSDKYGNELFMSLGTASSTKLVADINPGTSGSSPNALNAIGGKLYFRANDGTNGYELWVYDPATTKASMVKNIYPGSGSSYPYYLCKLGSTGKFVFQANNGSSTTTPPGVGSEIWISDGTSTGTVLLKDIYTGTSSSSPSYMTELPSGKGVVFRARTSTNGYELWVTDGTATGTVMVKDIYTGTGSGYPSNFIALGTKLLFQASNGFATGKNGTELWSTDGTAAGTVMVKDVRAGTGSGTYMFYSTVVGKKLYFRGSTTTNGTEIWESDGTSLGTKLAFDTRTGTSSGYFNYPRAIEGKVWFQANSGKGYEPHVFDPATGKVTMVADIYNATTTGSSYPRDFCALGTGTSFKGCIFYAYNGTSSTSTPPGVGYEIWISDGTAAGTKLLKDINPKTGSSYPSYMTETIPGRAIFRANDGTNGTELWFTDGTAAGTSFVDINPLFSTASSYPSYVTPVFGKLFFSANDGKNGTELWASDGTAAGTKMVKDIRTGSLSGYPSYICRLGNKVVFYAYSTASGYELWESDGTSTGTKLLKDIRSGSISSYPRYMSRVHGKVYFYANDGSTGYELWVTDGTAAGTKLFKDLRTGSLGSYPMYITELGHSGKFVFRASTSTTGYEIFISDGTPAGTKLLKDIRAGTMSSFPGYFAPIGGKVWFYANNGTNGYEPWVTDGTLAGTKMVKDIYTGTSSSSARYFAGLGNGKVYFYANDGSTGYELWVTDGTATGTKLLKDIRSGTLSSYPSYITEAGTRHLWFAADDGTKGRELWTSDGTATGTVLGGDIWTGSSSSSPYNTTEGYRFKFAVMGGKVYFRANDGKKGYELWSMANGATSTRIGDVCGSSAMDATDPVLGGSSTISGSTGVATLVNAHLLGILDPSPAPTVGKCDSYLDVMTKPWVLIGATTTKAYKFSVGIPSDTTLIGAQVGLQTWHFPTFIPADIEKSNGVDWVLGK